MKKLNITLALLLIASMGKLFAANVPDNVMLTARMNGQQETPPVNTPGHGLAAAILSPNFDTLCITASWVDLTGPATGAHIHVGVPGQSGAIVISLTPFISASGNQLGATISDSDLTPQIIGDLLAGRYYLNVHTAQHPDGEIRGQLMVEANETYVARMDAQQETPPNASPGRGLAVFSVAPNEKSIRFVMYSRLLYGPTMNAHLHTGAPGQAGPPVVDLMPFVFSLGTNYFSGVLDSVLFPDLNAFLADLRSGNIYVNVHTDSFPNGELRGQLVRERGLGFTAQMDNSQVVPAATVSTGVGVAYFSMNAGADTLRYEGVFGGLTAVPTSAHLHFGPFGASGPIDVDLTNGLQTPLLEGTVADTTVNHTVLRHMLTGSAYVDLHTPENPGGEIRGQLIPSARSGYSFLLTGDQLAPVVSTNGYGSGFVTVDPFQNMARYDFVYGGLNSNVTGVSFNTGAAGNSGPLLFDAMPFVSNNGGMGYWTSADTINQLFPGIVQTLYNEGAYLVVRTANNPSGELRGQIRRGLACNSFAPDSVNSVPSSIDYGRELNVFPNPTAGESTVTARYVSSVTAEAVISVYDMVGKKIIEQRVNALVGTNNFPLDMSGFGKGIYTVRLTVGDNTFSQRLSVQ